MAYVTTLTGAGVPGRSKTINIYFFITMSWASLLQKPESCHIIVL